MHRDSRMYKCSRQNVKAYQWRNDSKTLPNTHGFTRKKKKSIFQLTQSKTTGMPTDLMKKTLYCEKINYALLKYFSSSNILSRPLNINLNIVSVSNI